jgi:enolase-phosphatase E1
VTTPPPAAVLTDIEGTTTRISFVHDVLFPYARQRLPAYLAQHQAIPELRAVLADVAALAPGLPVLDTLMGWMDEDAKVTPLKTLQGLIWAEGYAIGALHSELYPDVAPALRRWHAAGTRLFVYSSGSVAAQKLLFANTPDGDLTPLFSDFFDTRVGGKRAPQSYAGIIAATGLLPGDVLFLSDVAEELDAANVCGLQVCQLLRPQDGTRPSAFTGAPDFDRAGALFGLAA